MKSIKINIIFIGLFLSILILRAQVGINNISPSCTLHVTPTSTDGNTAEGIISPNLTRSQLISKDNKYGSDQKGAMIYVTSIDGIETSKTKNILKEGYYYFDGNNWQSFNSKQVDIPDEPWMVQGSNIQATRNTENIFQIGSVGIGSPNSIPNDYKFQVEGASNITGNSRVGSSNILGDETVGGTFDVTGIAKMGNNLVVIGNTGLGTLSPTERLYVSGNGIITGISKIGGQENLDVDTTLNTSAQLELGDRDKGFLPNRVSLISVSDKTPLKKIVDGMIVYNTSTVVSQGITPGFYYWMNSSWHRFIDQIPTINANKYYQTSSVRAGFATGSDQSNMISLTLSRTSLDKDTTKIKLPESGSYAFNVKLYTSVGSSDKPSITNPQNAGKVVVYIGIWVNDKLQDVSEVFIVIDKLANSTSPIKFNGNFLTNVVLSCTGNAGDIVDLKVGYYKASLTSGEYIWSVGLSTENTRSDATSVIYWKL